MISLRKLKGKGTASEVKKVLGWIINTRKMTMALPETKGREWKRIITDLLSSGVCHPKDLECLIRKLV